MMPKIVQTKLQELEVLEFKIRELKEFEQKFDEVKQELLDLMLKHNVDSYTTPNGIKFTMVKASSPKTEITMIFDTQSFKQEYPDLFAKYNKREEKTTKGRKAYLRMSLEKEEE